MQNSLTKKLGLTVAAMAMAVTSLFTGTDAEAVPAFARQTGMSCNSCHFQGFPSLNGMGRNFRATGYTMAGGIEPISGMSGLGKTMPFSLFWKAYWQTAINNAGTANETDVIKWEDEFVFFAAGAVTANAGYLFELGMDGFNNSKLHFNLMQSESGMNVAFIPFSTDAAGKNFPMTLTNTASQRSQRPIEKRDAMSPAQTLGTGNGEATGLAFNASNMGAGWSATYSMWGPVHNGGAVSPTGMAANIRIEYFMDLAGFDTGIAFDSASGTVKGSTDSGVTQDYNIAVGGSNIDFQMQGQVGGNDLGFYLQSTTAGDSDSNASGVVSGAGQKAGGGSGLGLLVKYSVDPAVQVFYGMNSGTAGTDNPYAISVMGAHYMVDHNMRIVFENYSNATGDGVTASTKTYIGWMIGF